VRYLVLADIHGNLEALESVLADAGRRGFDRTLVLGDLVGYGADPNEVIARVIELDPEAIVRGNHDKAASGLETPDGFNVVARSAVAWTFDTLTPGHRTWLAALPRGPRVVDDLIEICHGSPADEDAYIFDELDARRALDASERRLCLFGHTHLPVSFELPAGLPEDAPPRVLTGGSVRCRETSKYLVNPGAVGQPRDADPRAAYALVDGDRRQVELVRLRYPVERAQAKIVGRGLPPILAARLAVGR
jgi:diadenosine tetraphosphatase ApaH/serine/threonine PP2A family protein phosphatase